MRISVGAIPYRIRICARVVSKPARRAALSPLPTNTAKFVKKMTHVDLTRHNRNNGIDRVLERK